MPQPPASDDAPQAASPTVAEPSVAQANQASSVAQANLGPSAAPANPASSAAPADLVERLRAAEARLDYLLALDSVSQDLQAFFDRNYIYRYVNETFLSYYPRAREEVLGRHISDVVGAAAFAGRLKIMFDRALNGETVHFQGVWDFPGKGVRNIDASYAPARDRAGNIIGVVTRVHDIDHLTGIEEQLKHSIAALERSNLAQQHFIYILSHDLREPINTIVNFSSLLQEEYPAPAAGQPDPPLDAKGRKFIDYIAAGGRRMQVLVDDLLRYVRLEQAGEVAGEVDLNEIIAEVQSDLADLIERNDAAVEYARLPVVAGQRVMLRLLLQNLVSNAVKFHRPEAPPRIRVSVAEEPTHWVLAVTDNGIGIKEQYFGRIFEIFRRLHPGREYAGTGIGLALCRKIAEMHGGAITVQSEPGAGSTFLVTLVKA